MNRVLQFVGGGLVAAALAVVLSLYVFDMPLRSALETGLLAGSVALIIVHMNTQGDSTTGTKRNQG